MLSNFRHFSSLLELQEANEVLQWTEEKKRNIFPPNRLGCEILSGREGVRQIAIDHLIFYARQHAALKSYFQNQSASNLEDDALKAKLINWTALYNETREEYNRRRASNEDPLGYLHYRATLLNSKAQEWMTVQRVEDVFETIFLREANKMPGQLFY